MHFRLHAAALLFLAPLCLSAGAETVDFSLSGLDSSSTPYTVTFSLDPSAYSANPYYYAYQNVAVSYNGSTETDRVTFSPQTGYEYVSFFGSSFLTQYDFLAHLGELPVMGDPSTGLPPTVNAGTYFGNSICAATVTMPHLLPSALTTLGLMQMPTISIGCGDPATLSVAMPSTPPPPTATTPEPSTLALLGTGALGVIGAMRRRLVR